jgi:hypothetical protein
VVLIVPKARRDRKIPSPKCLVSKKKQAFAAVLPFEVTIPARLARFDYG